MHARQDRQPARRHAPLDPFVIAFLGWIEGQPGGFALTADGKTAAAALGWPVAFLEVVFTSARMRRLLAPNQPLGRGRVRWTLSPAGAAILAVAIAPDAPGSADSVADLLAEPVFGAENGAAIGVL